MCDDEVVDGDFRCNDVEAPDRASTVHLEPVAINGEVGEAINGDRAREVNVRGEVDGGAGCQRGHKGSLVRDGDGAPREGSRALGHREDCK